MQNGSGRSVVARFLRRCGERAVFFFARDIWRVGRVEGGEGGGSMVAVEEKRRGVRRWRRSPPQVVFFGAPRIFSCDRVHRIFLSMCLIIDPTIIPFLGPAIRWGNINPPCMQHTLRANHRRTHGREVPARGRHSVRQAVRVLRLRGGGRPGVPPREGVPLRRGGWHEERGGGR